jgi:carboxymethylenebutenolidase
MFGHMNSLTNAMVCEDVLACMDHADQDDAAKDGPAGTVGYCMSGPFTFAAAAAFPERITAAASLHGVRLCTEAEDSPHRQADRIRGELYFGCAETDEWAPTEMIDSLDAHLVFPGREGIYHKAAAERHWERLVDLFGRNL